MSDTDNVNNLMYIWSHNRDQENNDNLYIDDEKQAHNNSKDFDIEKAENSLNEGQQIQSDDDEQQGESNIEHESV